MLDENKKARDNNRSVNYRKEVKLEKDKQKVG